jgi:Zn-dependent protease/CBS domain-containing protein
VGAVTGLTLGRVFGTEVRAHWTWVPIIAFIAVIFGVDLTNGSAAVLPTWLAWGSSISTAVLVFASVAAHELAHVRVARMYGQQIPVVVVQLLGGPYVMEVKPGTAGEEMRISLAGPVFSFLMAVVFGVVGALIDFGPLSTAPDPIQAIGFVATMIAVFNTMLCIVNLVPGYPMDGARALHGFVWRRTGNDQTATAATVRVGRSVGVVLIMLGLLSMVFYDALVGFALVISGWMMMNSSKFMDRRTGLQELIAGLHAGDALDGDPGSVPPQLTLDVFAAEYLGERNGAAAMVVRGDDLVGLIGTAQIRRIPARSWPNTHTEQAMVPIANVPTVGAEMDLWAALETLERARLDALLVTTGEAGTHLLTRRSAAKLVHEKAEQRQRQLAALVQVKRSRFRGR